MLTPQEVSERAFQKASFGGYHMGQVDEFLDILTADYSALYNENAVLKSKMKVLVDKVEEYRATEEAMRKALMTAQRMADDLVQQAEQRKAEILRQAEQEASRRSEQLRSECANEEFRLQKAQAATAEFVAKVRALQLAQSDYLDRLQELCPESEAPAVPDPVAQTADEIDDSVQRLLAKAMQQVAYDVEQEEEQPGADEDDTAEFAPVTEPAPVQDNPRISRIDFGELQFGRDYEIK